MTGHCATLFTSGTTALDNATLTIGNAAAGVAGNADSLIVLGPSSLTLGKGLNLIDAGAGTATVSGNPTSYSQTVSLTNDGTVNAGTSGATLLFQRNPSYSMVLALTNDGTMEASNGGTLSIQSDTLTSNGTIDIGANSAGVISTPSGFANHGVLHVESGATATVSGPLISGVGAMVIGSGGDLILNAASVVSTQTVAFGNIGTTGPVSTLKLGNPSTFSGTIDGFTMLGDTLELVGQTVTGASITGSTLNVTLAAGAPMTFNLADTPVSTQLRVSGDTVSVAVGPSITGGLSGQAITDQQTSAPFANITISDLAGGQTETVVVTLSAAANGSLSGTSGTYDPSTGTYTTTGSPTAVTAALESQIFTPTAHQVAPGQTVSTVFTIKVIDTAGITATDSTPSVIVTDTSAPRPRLPGHRRHVLSDRLHSGSRHDG